MLVILPRGFAVNATAIYFVGFKSNVGSTFAVCLDCQFVRSPTRQFEIIDAHDSSIPGPQAADPVSFLLPSAPGLYDSMH